VLELEHASAPGTADGLEQTPEYRRFVVLSSTAWGAALEASGMATAAEAAAVTERTAALYAPGVDQGA
jgi:hypothetical protein